jgi:hypothetical protein
MASAQPSGCRTKVSKFLRAKNLKVSGIATQRAPRPKGFQILETAPRPQEGSDDLWPDRGGRIEWQEVARTGRIKAHQACPVTRRCRRSDRDWVRVFRGHRAPRHQARVWFDGAGTAQPARGRAWQSNTGPRRRGFLLGRRARGLSAAASIPAAAPQALVLRRVGLTARWRTAEPCRLCRKTDRSFAMGCFRCPRGEQAAPAPERISEGIGRHLGAGARFPRRGNTWRSPSPTRRSGRS